MNPIIKNYRILAEDEDLVYTEHLAYQRDMTKSVEYGEEYYRNYVGREGTKIARTLNLARTAMTEEYCARCVLDVGIGSGEFIKSSRLKVYGFDINPHGVKWLRDRGLFMDPYLGVPPEVEGVTLWDTLEHIPDPTELLAAIRDGQYLFVSLPTFDNILEIKKSKHFKPGEHYYYFTVPGLIRYLKDFGFCHLSHNDDEVKAGREGITAFAFVKAEEIFFPWEWNLV